MLALAGRGVEPLQRRLPDVLPLGLRHRREEREQQLPGPSGVVDAGQGSGEHLQDQAVGGEVVGERGEFGGVAAEPLHLVHGEDDPAVRGVRLDLPRRPQRLLEPGRTRTRVLIFSLKILSLGMPCLLSASSWESSSCPRVEQRA
jgi:hypothetical protein